MWALGVIAYVLLSGKHPFDGHNTRMLKDNIRSLNYDFEGDVWSNISNNCIDFIEAVLVTNPDQRLNTMQALNHPWMLNVDIGIKTQE